MRRLLVLIWLAAMSSVALAQDQAPKVAIMPFVVHGQEETPATQKMISDLLNRQFATEGIKTVDPLEVQRALRPGESVQSEDQARAVGRRIGADFALIGSFNQIGNSVSLDAKLVDVSGRKKTEVLFAEEKGMENLAAAANGITQQAAVHLLAKALIADVRVKGNERIEAAAILLNVKSKKGELLKPAQVSEDIKAIYKTGFFEKVDADVSDSASGKILIFVVQENPTVQEVLIKGNKKIKEKDIQAAISTKPYTLLQRNVVSEDVQKIIKLYHQKGYFDVDVKSSIAFPKDPRKAVVTFTIVEHKKVYIKEISFKGNKHFSNRKLRGVMQTKEKSILSLFTDRGILQRDILETDIDRLTVFYHDKGFMDAKVGSPEISHRPDGFHIEIPVEEGERYKVKDVKYTGDTLENSKDMPKNLKIKTSDYFSREYLRQDIERISRAYMDEGYAHTEVSPNVTRNPSNETTEINFQVKKGEKVRIGRIFITGNTKTRDKVIRRELKINEGDLYSSTKLEKSIGALKKLDFFEDVEIVPSETPQSGIMDLHVKVKEKLTGTISVGGGYSSDDGLFASGEINQRNLFGRGEYLGLKLYFGQQAQRYVLSFTEPWVADTPWTAGIDLYNWLRDYSDFTKDAKGFRMRASYPFGQYSKLNTYYTFEDVKMQNVDSALSTATDLVSLMSLSQQGIKSSVTIGAERDTTDNPFLPTKGSVNSISAEYTTPYFGSDFDFLKTEVHSGWYFPLFWKFVGFVRGEAGWIVETGNKDVPIYERFFLGGINSLRAFNWGDVGPQERVTVVNANKQVQTDVVVGGFEYAMANFEFLFPLVEKLGMRGVIFFDAGNAYSKDAGIDFSDIRTDAGAGIRWNSPLGPLRIEWGYNLDPREGESQSKWQFSTGAFF